VIRLRWGPIVLAAVAAEILGVLALVALVAAFGPPGFEAATPFAQRLGQWIGPISGFVLCSAGGYWVARGAGDARVANGVGVGIAGAVLDLATGFALGGTLNLLAAVSNLGRIVGGALGGGLAARVAGSRGEVP
jgi:hypothetical protein